MAKRYAEQGVAGLEALPGVGTHIARTLAELFDRGRIERLDRLRDKTGVDVLGLLAIDGIGPKRLRTLWRELRVRSVEDLEQAVAQRCLQGLPGFGVRSEERLGEILELRRRSSRRMALARARTIAEGLREALERHPKVIRCEIAGSIRRRRKDVGDIDLVVASNDADAVAHDFLEREDIALVHAKGPHRISVALDAGIDCDVRVVPPDAFGSALLYFTGSRAHTIALRQLALAQGLHLNEYGLYRGKRKIAGESEEGIYTALSLPWLPPEKRRGQSEIRDALRGLRNDAR